MTLEEIKIRQLTNQYLIEKADKLTVVKDICSVQSQFLVNAIHSLRIRCNDFNESTVSEGLVKNWTLRGTVHVFAESDLPLFVRCNNGKDYLSEDFFGFHTWRKPNGEDIWYNEDGNCEYVYALTPEREKYFLHVILEALKDGGRTREELKILCREAGMTASEEDAMFNPWGGAIGTFCHRGFIHHMVQEKKAFCLSPEFIPIPDEEAKLEIARRYFTNIAPATIHDAMYFLGAKQAEVKKWLTLLPVKSIEYNGRTYFYIENGKNYNKGIPECIFLAGFDQLMLGYQKKESLYLPPEYLRNIFNLAGIVMPSVLLDGRVVGKWKKKNSKLTITFFEKIKVKDKKIITETAEKLWSDLKNIVIE